MALVFDAPLTVPVPLKTDSHGDGAIRVGGTRVTLDVVVDAFHAGESPEEIVLAYPTLQLADVYEVIAYYLRHKEAVDGYLAEREREAAALRARIEADFEPQGIRERLLARRPAQ